MSPTPVARSFWCHRILIFFFPQRKNIHFAGLWLTSMMPRTRICESFHANRCRRYSCCCGGGGTNPTLKSHHYYKVTRTKTHVRLQIQHPAGGLAIIYRNSVCAICCVATPAALQRSQRDWQVVKRNVSSLSAGKNFKVYGIMWVTGD